MSLWSHRSNKRTRQGIQFTCTENLSYVSLDIVQRCRFKAK